MMRAWTVLHRAPKFADAQKEKTAEKEKKRKEASVDSSPKAHSEPAISALPSSPTQDRPSGGKKAKQQHQEMQAREKLIAVTNRKAAAVEELAAMGIMTRNLNDENLSADAREYFRLKQTQLLQKLRKEMGSNN